MPVVDIQFDEQIASTVSGTTINQFHRWLSDGSLVLRPPFQRQIIWNDSQRSLLVDSILRGLPIPEVYIQTLTAADGNETITVVDGQQRINACLRFLRDELRLPDDEELDQHWRNRRFSDLRKELQERFRSYELLVRKLPARLDESVLREIFRRLNRTVEPLVAQELRHAAYTGAFIRFIEAAGAYPVLGEIGVFSARDYLRRRSDELMAEIAFAVISKAFPNKKEGLDALFLTYEKQGVPPGVLEELAQRFGRVFVQMAPLAATLRRTRFRNKSDFYTLFVALARSAEQLPLPDSALFSTSLRAFSDRVNDIKAEEAQQRSIDGLTADSLGKDAIKYLRSVERAASDRLSRVRRHEAFLAAVLGPAVAAGVPSPLGSADSAWLGVLDAIEDEPEDDAEDDLAEARETLLGDVDDVVGGIG
jgi:hypothetical protein